ncbi:hypothetical protein FNF07_23190 [Trinickia caryophylli]|nr:hypothetical protein FNF07_23190 [Trinickia caryophylli]
MANNAGYEYEAILEESTLEQWRKRFEVNVFGSVPITAAGSLWKAFPKVWRKKSKAPASP